jgi:hypothetical protein
MGTLNWPSWILDCTGFKKEPSPVKPNQKNMSGQSANQFLRYSPEHKIHDVHLAAILHLGWHMVFERYLPLVDLNT